MRIPGSKASWAALAIAMLLAVGTAFWLMRPVADSPAAAIAPAQVAAATLDGSADSIDLPAATTNLNVSPVETVAQRIAARMPSTENFAQDDGGPAMGLRVIGLAALALAGAAAFTYR